MTAMEHTWRWYGPQDPISLAEIRQTGATGIVTALHHIPTGEVWPISEINARKEIIEAAGFSWSVVESVPVHEDIKCGAANARRYIQNYKETLRNLADCGVDTVCYNFMPVLDWSRTDLSYAFHDGSQALAYFSHVMAAFDLYILQRPNAAASYSKEEQQSARKYFEQLSGDDQKKLVKTVLFGLPGSLEKYSLDQLRKAISAYDGLDEITFRENLYSFLEAVVPVAEACGVRLAIHPDDPPMSILGLPRIVSNYQDIKKLLAAVDSPANGLTLCTGSLGAGAGNNVAEIAADFSRRIHFVHLRNVRNLGKQDFMEDNHLEGDVDMVAVIRLLLLEQQRRITEKDAAVRLPMRPDHGHLMHPDIGRADFYPGYSLVGRMRGLAEIRGVEMALQRFMNTRDPVKP